MIQLIDVHCHLDFPALKSQRETIDLKLQEKGILALTNTVSFQNYKETKQLFEKAKNIKVLPGIYPNECEKITEDEFQNFLNHIKQNKDKIIGIGEIGLDKKYTTNPELFNLQIKRFKQIIELGIELDKPMIIHTRDAELEILEILEYYIKKHNFTKFNLHCFFGSSKHFQKIKDLQIFCSIPLIILNNHHFQKLVSFLPLSQILVETDSPFLHPEKKTNSPLNTPQIYKKIAQIKELDYEVAIKQIYENYRKLFK